MKIKITYTQFNTSVPRLVNKIYKVIPLGLPNGITQDAFSQKGSLLVGTGLGTYIELPPGANQYVLMYDSTQPSGLKGVSILGLSTLPRVTSIVSASSVTPNADTTDLLIFTALAAALSFVNPTGSPQQGQKLLIRILDAGVAKGLSFGTAYRAVGQTLPTTTTASKTMYLGFIYNTNLGKWDLIAKSTEV